jgi:arginyl-tRNA synthetase
MQQFRQEVIDALAPRLDRPAEQIDKMLGKPRKPEMGDLALPCHPFGKGKEAVDLARRLAQEIPTEGLIGGVEAVGPFLNFRISPTGLVRQVLHDIKAQGADYGSSSVGTGKTVVVDYSSPNIAKPFHVGHLRTTIIGAALCRVFEKNGYRVVRVNHLGDWGTQFGLTFAGFQEFGDEDRLEAEGVYYLADLYVAANQRADEDPEFRERARAAFKRLEDADEEVTAFWQRARDISLRDFKRIYDLMDIGFDTFEGEAFYNDKIDGAIEQAIEAGITEESEGALVVYVDEKQRQGDRDKPPLLLRKSDGASTYHARDLAAALYRKLTYDFDYNVYVVGSEQILHFQQLFKLLKKMGREWADHCVHVSFGRILGMSTRRGRTIRLEELFDEAVARAEPVVREQNDKLAPDDPARLSEEDIPQVAKAVGLGAVFFFDLSKRRSKDIEFDWERILQPIGDTGPYVQYAHARMCSILRKYDGDVDPQADTAQLTSPYEIDLVKALASFADVLTQAQAEYEPSLVGSWLLEVAEKANVFHKNCHVLRAEPDLAAARALLVDCTRTVLAEGLRVLHIDAPERM